MIKAIMLIRNACGLLGLSLLFLNPPVNAQQLTVGVEVHVFNVGQADATLIIGPPPERRSLLIDSGEELQGSKTHFTHVAEQISKYLGGKKTLNYVVISHYHFDHIGSQSTNGGSGLWGLFEQSGLSVQKLIDRGDLDLYGAATGPHGKLKANFPEWKAKGLIAVREEARLGKGQIDLGPGVSVEIVAVNGNGILEKTNQSRPGYFDRCPPSENDSSVALVMMYGNFKYYTGGDLAGANTDRIFPGSGCTSYNDVETSIAAKVGNVEVMKINHHGSAYSSNPYFLDTLAPEFVIVTSGAKNTYNHPSRDVMERAAQHAIVLITGGVSEQEWPGNRLDAGMQILDSDVDIYIESGGARYEILGEIHPTFSALQKQQGDDRQYFKKKLRQQFLDR